MWAKSWSCRVAPNKLVPFSLQTNAYFSLKHHWKWLRQAFKWLEVILDFICKRPPVTGFIVAWCRPYSKSTRMEVKPHKQKFHPGQMKNLHTRFPQVLVILCPFWLKTFPDEILRFNWLFFKLWRSKLLIKVKQNYKLMNETLGIHLNFESIDFNKF